MLGKHISCLPKLYRVRELNDQRKDRMYLMIEFDLLTDTKLQGYLAVTVEWWS